MIFKPLSREEYERLTLEQRMEYLQRLMADISQKLEENRRRLDEAQAQAKK